MNSLKKHFILVLFAILIGNTASFAQTQTEPDSQVLKAFEALDKISNYDNYANLDSLTIEQIEQGLQVCRKFLRRNNDSLTVSIFLYHKGRLEFVKNQYEESKTDLEKALENDASNYPALERLCVLTTDHIKGYSKRRLFINSSLYMWTKKCKIDSSNSFNWYYLAMTYDLNMKYTNVNTTGSILYCLDKCIQLDSNIALYYFDYAQFTDKDKKIGYLQKALQKEENWYYRAQIIVWYTENKMDEPLLEFVNKSINLYESKFPNYYFFLSDLYKSKGEIHKRQNNLALYNMCLDRAKYYQNLNY
jgi:tetratricopeptide (TPR) repeat protein